MAVGAECHRDDIRIVPLRVRELLPIVSIPDLESLVAPAGGDSPAVGAECKAIDHHTMAEQASDFRTRCRVPEPYRKVSAPSRQPRAVGAIGDYLYLTLMTGEATRAALVSTSQVRDNLPAAAVIVRPSGLKARERIPRSEHGIAPSVRPDATSQNKTWSSRA